ncbi:glycosyltransferase [Candidatus Uhrbacteria bacterium]|nr:glycosyltransferase [Candidatus Uhrbacteria bacterium]
MKDLHIVIVNWNTRDELERCLKSLPEACWDLHWECVVVDNGSVDGSAEMVERVFADEERIDLLANNYNLGFAAACNQGAVQHKSRHVLLLNPDTVCPPNSLTELVRRMDLNPHMGIMGPKLLNHDGSYQQSVRRFPSVLSQLLILLKLHHILPWLPLLKKYFADDIDPNKAQEVDQVMGACFLVRAECWDEMYGLDKRYFIWFEEVDACKSAKKNGWLVWYEPSVAVMHHGGRAFGKALTLNKQRYFNDSLKKYMRKWHGWPAWLIVSILHPVSLALASLVSLLRKMQSYLYSESDKQKPINEREKRFDPKHKKLFDLICRRDTREMYYWFLGIVFFEIISFITLDFELTRTLITLVAALGFAYLAYKKPGLALAVVGLEIWIGGFGYLMVLDTAILNLGILEMGVSLRMVLMIAFALGWGVNAIRAKIWQYWRLDELFLVQAWVFVALMILAGTFHGFYLNQPHVIQDANAWAFLLYFIPVLDIAHRYKNSLIRHAKGAFVAAAIFLPIKALAVFYIFSHGITALADPLYTWIRDTRVGEMTPAGGNVFRVFFQSGIYSIVILFFLFAYWIQYGGPADKDKVTSKLFSSIPCYLPRYGVIVLWVISATMVIISLSRSFWFGAAVGGAVVLALGLIKFGQLPWKACLKGLGGIAGSVLVLAAILYFPFPKVGDVSLASMIKDRGTVTDAAGASRWNLLPAMWEKIGESPIIGSGFGSTVTYESRDPRILKDNPDGIYTTYAYEWGWLSFWVKFGIFGPLIVLWLVISLAWRSLKASFPWWIRAGMVGSIACFSAVHIFTPYLNHPLGFSFLLSLEGILAMGRDNTDNLQLTTNKS